MENHVLLRIEDTSNTTSSSSSSKVQDEGEEEDDKDIDFHEKMIHLFKGLEKEKRILVYLTFRLDFRLLRRCFLSSRNSKRSRIM